MNRKHQTHKVAKIPYQFSNLYNITLKMKFKAKGYNLYFLKLKPIYITFQVILYHPYVARHFDNEEVKDLVILRRTYC